MKIWPTDSWTLNTSHSLEQTKAILVALSAGELASGRFQGKVFGNEFELNVRSERGNAFRPYLSGTLAPAGDGTMIKLRAQLWPMASSFFALALIITFAVAWRGGFAFTVAALTPWVFPVGIYLYVNRCFWTELDIAKATLNQQLISVGLPEQHPGSVD